MTTRYNQLKQTYQSQFNFTDVQIFDYAEPVVDGSKYDTEDIPLGI